MTVEEIEEAILRLPPPELARLRAWLAEFETGMSTPLSQENKAARFGRIAGRAVADFRKRLRDP